MTDESVNHLDLHQLEALAQLHEQPFQSDVPLIGPLIAWFRSGWNSVATKWYVQPMMAQQTAYNQAAMDYLRQLQAHSARLEVLAEELDKQVVEQDREATQLARDLGATTSRIAQLRATLLTLQDETKSGDERPS